MIPYILHVALLISVCLLFYKIFLQRETFYRLNRVVLLICLGLSFVLPLISIPQAWTLRVQPTETAAINQANIKPNQQSQATVPLDQLIQKQAVEKAQPVKAKPVVAQDKPVIQEKPIWPKTYWQKRHSEGNISLLTALNGQAPRKLLEAKQWMGMWKGS